MVLPGTGWEVIGEDAAAGGAAGTGDWAGCVSAAAESASSATTAAEARWLDRIVFIESFLRSDVVRDLEGRCRGPRQPRWASDSVAVINGRWRCIVIGWR